MCRAGAVVEGPGQMFVGQNSKLDSRNGFTDSGCAFGLHLFWVKLFPLWQCGQGWPELNPPKGNLEFTHVSDTLCIRDTPRRPRSNLLEATSAK